MGHVGLDLDHDEIESLALGAVDKRRQSPTGVVRASCPFCPYLEGSPDRKVSFSLNRKTGWYSCWRCHTRGRLSGDYVELPDRVVSAPKTIDPPEGFFELFSPANVNSKRLAPYRDYVLSRPSVTPAILRAHRVGACVSGRMTGRVVVPVFDEHGKWRWYVGRTINKQEAKAGKKYLYPRGERGGAMFNETAIYRWTDTPVLIVEGCFDAIPYAPDAVGALGKPSETMYEKLLGARRPVVFVLDGDAHLEAWAMATRLRLDGMRAGAVKLPPRTDPDEVPAAVLRRLAVQSLVTGETEYQADEME